MLFHRVLVLIRRSFQWLLAERLRLSSTVSILGEVFFQQKLISLRSLDENRPGVKSPRIFYVNSQIRVARRSFRRQATTKAVNKIICVDGIAVGPACILSQVEDELRRVVVYMPALGDCGYRRHRLGM